MSEQTPGPWKAEQPDGNDPIIWINTAERPGATICTLHPLGWTIPTVRANARLIAAAPDLLAACEAALGYIEEYGRWGESRLHALRILESAIRAARGCSDD